MLPLAELVAVSRDVAATRSRTKKIERMAAVLGEIDGEEIAPVVGFLCGELRQGKLGLGYANFRELSALPAPERASVSALELDATFDALARQTGKGAARERERILRELTLRLSAEERDFVARLVLGALRQGALEGIALDAVAKAGKVSQAAVRRAMLFAGEVSAVAEAALRGGEDALAAFRLELFRPIRPMLAQTAKDVADAVARAAPCAFEHKLDGARIQLHKQGPRVAIYSRHGNELTESLPEIVELARGFGAESLLLDGEAIALRDDGRPRPFQETMQRFGRKLDVAAQREALPLRAFFFDCLLSNGEPLVDHGAAERWRALCAAVPESERVTRREITSEREGEAFMAEALAAGHEGVVVKSLEASYAAGKRGAAWLKLKPAPTLELVVLAVEWGSGRRKGWLSNLHLGARDAERGGFVMLGKTFKGLSDATLAWQTEKLQALATERDEHVVHVRPELVVEIAFDGLQKSPTYEGGLALRFARVKRYREDKPASEADTIAFVRSLYERSRRPSD